MDGRPRRLITGGAGFIGSHLAMDALERGVPIRILDDFSTGKRSNLKPLEKFPREAWEVVEGDITDYDACMKACEGVGEITHQAALGSVSRSVEDPIASHHANTTGTLTIFQCAKESGIRRVVYASSSSVYGDHPDLPKRIDKIGRPLSPYAASKQAGEIYAAAFHRAYGLETVGLRYFNVFGPRQDPNSRYAAVIPLFISALLEGQPAIIHGDGSQSRDFTYVSNVAAANRLALAAPASATGRAYNIACGDRLSILDLHTRLGELIGRSEPPQHIQRRAGDVDHSLADISETEKALGYRPEATLEEGLAETIAYYRNLSQRSD